MKKNAIRKMIPVGGPHLDGSEKKLVDIAMNRGEISGFSGGFTEEFEKAFSKYCETKYGVAVSNGTVALHLALATLKIKAGDEVLVSSLTNMATFFAVLYLGAKPVPLEIENDSWNVDPLLIESKITKRTKAIIIVHLYGHPADMDPIRALAKKRKLFLIEDAAEAHGSLYKGKKVGSLSDIACFSFYANKIITTGEGGMLTMNNLKLKNRANMLKGLAFGVKNKFMHQDIGYNFRMTNLQAAIGCAQLKKIDYLISKKRAIADFYNKAFKDIESIQLPVEKSYAKNVYWMYNVVLRGRLKGKRALFMSMLKKNGIDTRESFIPFNGQEIFIKMGLTKKIDCPIANYVGANGFYLPSGPILSIKELNHVAQYVNSIALDLGK